MTDMTQTAATIAGIAPSLVRETQAAHDHLSRQVQQRAEQVYQYTAFKNVGRIQLAISTLYIPVDDETVRQCLYDGHGHALIISSVRYRRLPRPTFEIVTRRGRQVTRCSGYRLWLAPNGDSALLTEKPGRPAWRVAGTALVRARVVGLGDAERREGFARADRMLRRIAWDA